MEDWHLRRLVLQATRANITPTSSTSIMILSNKFVSCVHALQRHYFFCRWAVASKKAINKNVLRQFVDSVPKALRHELSSPARTRRSCSWIPVEAWMYVWFYCLFVLPCVWVRGLVADWSTIQGVLPTVYSIIKGMRVGCRAIDKSKINDSFAAFMKYSGLVTDSSPVRIRLLETASSSFSNSPNSF
jgi:hypothetical protein